MGDREQGNRRRKEERVGPGENDEPLRVAQGRPEGRLLPTRKLGEALLVRARPEGFAALLLFAPELVVGAARRRVEPMNDERVPPPTPGSIAEDVAESYVESDHAAGEALDRAADAARNARGSEEAGGPARLDRAGAPEEERDEEDRPPGHER